jgi:8-oxo-dGTP pyrophosphatase MutT (NUDIX family)
MCEYSTHSFIKTNKLCCNCGKIGHVYKKCNNPITSFGIICFKNNDLKSISSLISNLDWKTYTNNIIQKINNFQFLLIKRKDSLAFAEFVSVKYNIKDTEYIKKLLSNMTKDEVLFLKNTINPTDIWNKLWVCKKSKNKINKYLKNKKKLNSIIHGTINKENIDLKTLINSINTKREEPEWGFPKGRRFIKESDLECAIREFCEETDINKNNINILKNISPIEETFIGSNNILYKHVYYIAELKNNVSLTINLNNENQFSEIGDIKWFSYDDAIEKIEIKNKERIDIFTKISSYISSLSY